MLLHFIRNSEFLYETFFDYEILYYSRFLSYIDYTAEIWFNISRRWQIRVFNWKANIFVKTGWSKSGFLQKSAWCKRVFVQKLA